MIINPQTKLYGFFAHPAGHTLSPAMHNRAFKSLNINAAYLAFDIPAENLEPALLGAQTLGIKGLSISIPHKIEIMKFCDELDENARLIGAVNTIKFHQGRILGFNTDIFGIIDAIKEKSTLKAKNVIILGAGGTARTAIYAAHKMAARKITIFNRTLEKAAKLAKETGVNFGSLEEFTASEGSVIINTTSVGLNSDKSPLRKEQIPSRALVFDAVYQPRQTKLLDLAREKKAETVEGLKMLLYQGIKQFEIWTEKVAPKDLMWQEIDTFPLKTE